ncbi:polyketide synthase [Colletotrichum tofieldiae]|nr:polyketide synthase [Colletotrichum tofieldiae]
MQEGVAEVVLAPTPKSSFTLNPYWVDSLTHLAGFLVNGDPAKSADSLFMMNSYDSHNIVEPLEPDLPYTVYTRVISREKKSAVVNVYVFREERLIMQNLGLHLQEIPTSLIARMIGIQDFNISPGAPVPRSVARGINSPVAISDRITSAMVEVRPAQPQARKLEADLNKVSLVDTLLSTIAQETGCEMSDLTTSTKLAGLGVDSIMAIQIAENLQAKLGLEVGASLFHEHPSIGELQTALVLRTALTPGRVEIQKQDTLLPTQSNGISGALSSALSVNSSPVGGHSGLFEVLLSNIATETGAETSDTEGDFTTLSDLGVDSIMAMQITTAVREQTGIDIHPSVLVENPTIGSTAAGTKTSTFGRRIIEDDIWQRLRRACPNAESGYVGARNGRREYHSHHTFFATDIGTCGCRIPGFSRDPESRKASGHVPLFMFPDGAGGASTYMYLKRFRNDRPLYVLESPYLHNPQEFTVGVEEVSTLFKQAVLDVYPSGNFLLAGYSGGAIYAYETARQLIEDGHVVQGLLLFDMAVPRLRPDPGMPPAISLLLPPAMVKARNWADPIIMRNQQVHMAQMVRTVAEYNPVPMPPGRWPRRTWLTWCKRGIIERHDDDARRQLRQSGILTEAIPNFMEDPAVGPFAWAIPPGKPLGPNGWDELVGNVRCTSIDADHFTMIIPPDALEDALVYSIDD